MTRPAIQCRGREYRRIVYGPEYAAEENSARLRPRALEAKRSLARREFALGVEALERFVRREPLRRVQEGVCGALALESEPVGPRLCAAGPNARPLGASLLGKNLRARAGGARGIAGEAAGWT